MLLFLLACRGSPEPSPQEPAEPWQSLAPGLELGIFRLPKPPLVGDGLLYAARIDPARFSLSLRMATRDGVSKTLPDWAADVPAERAVVGINASMFQDDWVRSVGLMVEDGHVNHDGLAADHNSLLAAHPRTPGAPPVWLANLGCADVEAVRAEYRLLVQSIRMLGCDGENVWSQQPRQWSAAIIGQDTTDRVLFLHTRSPWSMHDLVEMLRDLPLSLKALHYADGGPPATLLIRTPTQSVLRIGSYETGINENDRSTEAWELPNVVLAVERP